MNEFSGGALFLKISKRCKVMLLKDGYRLDAA